MIAVWRPLFASRVALPACFVALVVLWRSRSFAAVPSALLLVSVAESDLKTRRFSLGLLGSAAAMTIFGLALDSWVRWEWGAVVRALVMAGAAGVLLLGVWVVTRAIAFGDVLLVVFAMPVPAWLSLRAAGVTLLVALAVAGCLAIAQARRRRTFFGGGTVAVGPPLLVGWLAGIVVG